MAMSSLLSKRLIFHWLTPLKLAESLIKSFAGALPQTRQGDNRRTRRFRIKMPGWQPTTTGCLPNCSHPTQTLWGRFPFISRSCRLGENQATWQLSLQYLDKRLLSTENPDDPTLTFSIDDPADPKTMEQSYDELMEMKNMCTLKLFIKKQFGNKCANQVPRVLPTKCSHTEAYLMCTSVKMFGMGLFSRAGGQINGWLLLIWAGGTPPPKPQTKCTLIATHYYKLWTAIVFFRRKWNSLNEPCSCSIIWRGAIIWLFITCNNDINIYAANQSAYISPSVQGPKILHVWINNSK